MKKAAYFRWSCTCCDADLGGGILNCWEPCQKKSDETGWLYFSICFEWNDKCFGCDSNFVSLKSVRSMKMKDPVWSASFL